MVRKILLGLLLLPSFGLAGDHDAAVRECTQLVTDYAYFRDRPDADRVAALFTDDAKFSLMGTHFNGREAIRKRVAAGQGGPVFRHMMSTIKIQVAATGDQATGVSYVTVYQGSAEALPQGMLAPMAIGEYHDQFVKTDQGWKIATRTFQPVFLNTPDS